MLYTNKIHFVKVTGWKESCSLLPPASANSLSSVFTDRSWPLWYHRRTDISRQLGKPSNATSRYSCLWFTTAKHPLILHFAITTFEIRRWGNKGCAATLRPRTPWNVCAEANTRWQNMLSIFRAIIIQANIAWNLSQACEIVSVAQTPLAWLEYVRSARPICFVQ